MVTASILMENTLVGHRGLEAEHGFSALIEEGSISILFDTGSSAKFLLNAKKLNKDLSKVSSVVLSHPHYDHTGGFPHFVDQWKDTEKKLYTGIDFFSDRFEENSFSFTYLGNSFSQEYVIKMGLDWQGVHSLVKVSSHIWVVSGFVQLNSLEKVSTHFKKYHENRFVPDIFSDECSIVLEAKDGLHLIVGCAHIGILNIVEHVSRLFSKPVRGVYGGIHLMNSTRAEIRSVIEGLTSLGVKKYGLCHCSGSLVSDCLHEYKDLEVAALGPASMLVW
ncbi:MAG TPA: MBL fold metallo-hydrolase [Sphaerochaeta sp.]|nr:MBL fold metallo-hydrolase [Sphaerochaeta sp.]